MSLSNIQSEVFDRIITLGMLTYFPNIKEPDLIQDDHLRVDVMPNTTDSIGLNDIDMEKGIVQVRVFTKIGSGSIQSAVTAKQVLDLFPRNTQLTSCRFDKTGTINSAFMDGSWWVTPVTLQYQNLK